jgi:hypothetical protein
VRPRLPSSTGKTEKVMKKDTKRKNGQMKTIANCKLSNAKSAKKLGTTKSKAKMRMKDKGEKLFVTVTKKGDPHFAL